MAIPMMMGRNNFSLRAKSTESKAWLECFAKSFRRRSPLVQELERFGNFRHVIHLIATSDRTDPIM
jgi:hypothetical protein